MVLDSDDNDDVDNDVESTKQDRAKYIIIGITGSILFLMLAFVAFNFITNRIARRRLPQQPPNSLRFPHFPRARQNIYI